MHLGSVNEIQQVNKRLGTISTALERLVDMTELSTALVVSVNHKRAGRFTEEKRRTTYKAPATSNKDETEESRAEALWPDLAGQFERLEEKLGNLESSFISMLPNNLPDSTRRDPVML